MGASRKWLRIRNKGQLLPTVIRDKKFRKWFLSEVSQPPLNRWRTILSLSSSRWSTTKRPSRDSLCRNSSNISSRLSATTRSTRSSSVSLLSANLQWCEITWSSLLLWTRRSSRRWRQYWAHSSNLKRQLNLLYTVRTVAKMKSSHLLKATSTLRHLTTLKSNETLKPLKTLT